MAGTSAGASAHERRINRKQEYRDASHHAFDAKFTSGDAPTIDALSQFVRDCAHDVGISFGALRPDSR